MITVYFMDGNTATVPGAQSVEVDKEAFWPGLPYIEGAYMTLVCKDAGGKAVARFREGQVRGYVVSSETGGPAGT